MGTDEIWLWQSWIRWALAHMLRSFNVEICAETDEEWVEQRAGFTWEKKPL